MYSPIPAYRLGVFNRATAGVSSGVLNGPTTVTGYSNQSGLFSRDLDIRYWTGCAPRPTILIVHAGGWQGTAADRLTNGAVGAATLLANLGFNTVNIDYWGYDHAAGYNRNRPHTDVQNAITWCRNAGNASTYNLKTTSVNLLGQSAGGQLGWYCTMIGTSGTTRPDTMCSWSGPNEMEQFLTGVDFAYPNARSYMGGGAANDFVGHEATWRSYEPGHTNGTTSVLVNPGIPGRVVGSANESTSVGGGKAGVHWAQQTQLVNAAAALGSPYTITSKQFNLGAGYSDDTVHYNFTGDVTYGGTVGINDIVDSVVAGSGYVAWLAANGVTPT